MTKEALLYREGVELENQGKQGEAYEKFAGALDGREKKPIRFTRRSKAERINR